jgi:hypothetical protein
MTVTTTALRLLEIGFVLRVIKNLTTGQAWGYTQTQCLGDQHAGIRVDLDTPNDRRVLEFVDAARNN